MLEHIHSEPDEDALDVAMQLHQRSLSAEQIHKFESYIAEIFGAVGMDLTVELVEAIQTIPDIAGIHVMAMGHDAVTRDLVERTRLFPRPTV